MSPIRVDYTQLNQAAELLTRQSDHAQKAHNFIDENCGMKATDFGALLMVLYPINRFIVDRFMNSLSDLKTLAENGSETAKSTVENFTDADRRSHEDMRSSLAKLGADLPGFDESCRAYPSIGPAQSVAPDYAGIEPGVVTKPAWPIMTELDALRRDDEVPSPTGGVVERTDPSSYLKKPQFTTNEIENLRWNAGFILGSVDWVAEQLFGVSIIEDYIMKPLAGNWEVISGASAAWDYTSMAMLQIGRNFSGLPAQTDGWDGKAFVAFKDHMESLSDLTVQLAAGCKVMSPLLYAVSYVSQEAAAKIGECLKIIGDTLLSVAMEMAVPVAGWAAAAVTIAAKVEPVIEAIGDIVKFLNLLLDTIRQVEGAQQIMRESAAMSRDLAATSTTHR